MDLDLTLRAFGRGEATRHIEVARDGEEAMEWVDRWESGVPVPSVILLDLHLPKVDGMDVLRRIKAHEALRAVPVVVLTTSTEASDMATAYQLGANSFIVKPVAFEQFVEVAAQIDRYWTHLNHFEPGLLP